MRRRVRCTLWLERRQCVIDFLAKFQSLLPMRAMRHEALCIWGGAHHELADRMSFKGNNSHLTEVRAATSHHKKITAPPGRPTSPSKTLQCCGFFLDSSCCGLRPGAGSPLRLCQAATSSDLGNSNSCFCAAQPSLAYLSPCCGMC